jgi:hypothetical protein
MRKMTRKSISQFALPLAAALITLLFPDTTQAQPWNVPFVPVAVTELDSYNGLGQSADYGRKVVVSQTGRIYFMGQSLDVGKQTHLFIRCFQRNGTLLWSDYRALNGFVAQDLVVDADDNAFAIGRVYSNSGLASSHDVGILKYNSSGVSVREKVYELDYIEPLVNPFFNQNVPTAVAHAPNGKIYISGYVSDELFAVPTVVSHPYLFAVNPADSMSLGWTSAIHESSSLTTILQEVPASIAVTAASDVYEVSNYGGANKAVTLRKVTSSGENAWSDSTKLSVLAGRHHEAVHVGVDASGNAYITGHVVRQDDQGPETFVAKVTPEGAVVWTKTFSFGAVTDPKAAKVLADGSTIGVGCVDFNKWFIFRVNSQGQLVWQQRYNEGSAYDLAVDDSGNNYVVGVLFGDEVAVTKFNSSGQLLWTKTLPDAHGLPNNDKLPPTITIDATGVLYVTAHRNSSMSNPVEGETYPTYDAVLFRVVPPVIEPPAIRFLSPVEGQTVLATAPFPKITLEAISAAGIQRIALYDRHAQLRAMLTNAPYEVTLNTAADLSLVPLYAVAYDNAGYGSVAKLTTVIDIPEYTISLTQASLRISESEAFVRVVAKRTTLEGQAEVKVTLTPGTAGQNDYNHDGNHEPFSMYFNDGEDMADVLIAIEKDTLVEPNETFTVALSEPSAGKLGSVQSATVTIVDNDGGKPNPYGVFAFSAWDYHVSEGTGAIQVTVVRFEGTEGPASVGYYSQPNTADLGTDFLETRGVLNFAAGQTNSTLTFYVLKDGETEAPETFYITLDQPEDGAALGAKWYALVHIQDDASSTNSATLAFETASASVPEGQSGIILTVHREGNTSLGSSVSYVTSNGTAAAGSDYTAVSGKLTFNPQETMKVIQIPIRQDALTEGNETFFVELTTPEGGALGEKKKVTVTILDETQAPGETLSKWVQTTFTPQEQANPAISGDLADPDKDGYPNVIEYALGLDPKAENKGQLIQPGFVEVEGKPAFEIQFTRPKGRSDIDYIFEAVGSLGSQNCTDCIQITSTDNGDGTERVRVRLKGSLDAAKLAFLEFKIGKR